MTIRGIIYDCDGVLFESHRANLAYYNRVMEAFGKPEVTSADPQACHLCHTAASPVVFSTLLGDCDQQEVLRFAAGLDYRQFMPYMTPEPGMESTLQELSQRMPLAVATNRGTSMPEILAHFGLSDYFSVVVTSRDVPRPKPFPDMLWKAAERLELNPEELLFVGDSELDCQAATAAGIEFVAYKSDLGSRRITHHQELAQLLGQLTSTI